MIDLVEPLEPLEPLVAGACFVEVGPNAGAHVIWPTTLLWEVIHITY